MFIEPYLNDDKFLRQLDLETRRVQYLKIEVLDFSTENKIASIEGKATGGTATLNGASNMRRVANCSLLVDPEEIMMQGYSNSVQYNNITEIENLISMNKKVRLYTGLENTLDEYEEYSIIWFPIGTFMIKSANVNSNNSGVSISLTLHDKCALLNGDMGGTFPAATILSELEIYHESGGRTIEKIPLRDLIYNMMIEYGGEKAENIIITDIPDSIVKVVKWINKEFPVYLVTNGNKRYTFKKPEEEEEIYSTYRYGQDIGYSLEPFVYPGILEANPGETVSTVLDRIKNVLGNYEWFYDIFGKFHFQEKRNYLNQSAASSLLELSAKDYFNFSNPSLSAYVFDEKTKTIINSISNNPQYQNIKNDFIVWGSRQSASGINKPIRYHLTFDSKPSVSDNYYKAFVRDTGEAGTKITVVLTQDNSKEFSSIETMQPNKYYYGHSFSSFESFIYVWDETLKTHIKYICNNSDGKYWLVALKAIDWRSELYLQCLQNTSQYMSNNYYAAELIAEFPKQYDVMGGGYDNGSIGVFQKYKGKYLDGEYDYWLEILDTDPEENRPISQFSVKNIGRRTKVVTDSGANCLFPIEVPNYILVHADGDIETDIENVTKMGREAIQVTDAIWSYVSIGGGQEAAYDKIKDLLYTHTTYNESVTLSTLPIYHLEPNTRISIYDEDTGINGDYMIKSISLPLTTNGMSSISATKCLDKTF